MRFDIERVLLGLGVWLATASLICGTLAAQDPQPQPQPQPQPYPQQPQPYQQQQQPQPYQQTAPQQQQGYGQAYQQSQPQTVYITDFELPQNKITLQPIDLFVFGAINIEYERAVGEFFSLAAGAHLNLWEPLDGDIAGYSFRFVPRVYPVGNAPAGFVIGARIEYIYLTGDECLFAGSTTVCGAVDESGAAFGGFIGYDFLMGDTFALSLALGASYSTVGNPEWTLYAPAMNFDNLDGEDPLEGAVIPWFRFAVGFAF